MDSSTRLNFVADLAETMMQSGAETYRVEETVQYVLRTYTGNPGESFVSPTIIICTEKYDDEIKTITRRIKNRGVNLEKVNKANDLSRRITSGSVPLQDAIAELQEIRQANNHSFTHSTLLAAMSCAAFAFIFGGWWADAFAASIIAVLLYNFRHLLTKIEMSSFVSDILGGALVSFSALALTNIGIGYDINVVISSSIMLMVPGVLLANSFRDILEGDYLSGMSRLLEALFVAVCIALGVGVVLRLGVL